MHSHFTHALAIREAIWPLHARLETLPLMSRVAEGLATREEYVQALAVLYGFLTPLERGLADFASRMPGDGDLAAYLRGGRWSRLGLLSNDLRCLGMHGDTLGALQTCRDIPSVDSPERALGHLYVLEGSRLGGKVLAAKIKQSLGLDETNGCSYFSSAGMELAGYWSDFKKLLGSNACPESFDATIQAARNCFLLLEVWMKEWPN